MQSNLRWYQASLIKPWIESSFSAPTVPIQLKWIDASNPVWASNKSWTSGQQRLRWESGVQVKTFTSLDKHAAFCAKFWLDIIDEYENNKIQAVVVKFYSVAGKGKQHLNVFSAPASYWHFWLRMKHLLLVELPWNLVQTCMLALLWRMR